MQKKIYIILSLALLCATIAAFFVFGKRTQIEQSEIIITPKPKPATQEITTEKSQKQPEVPSNDITTLEETADSQSLDSKKSAYHITKEDCDNECTKFTQNTSPWRYCANICGIIKPKEPANDCAEKEGLSADYCIKNRAIADNKPDLCNTISDRGIAQQCQNQIIEGIVDGF